MSKTKSELMTFSLACGPVHVDFISNMVIEDSLIHDGLLHYVWLTFIM